MCVRVDQVIQDAVAEVTMIKASSIINAVDAVLVVLPVIYIEGYT